MNRRQRYYRGCTIDNSPLVGGWLDPETKEVMIDENIMYWIVCDKTSKNLALKKYEAKLRNRFEQRSMMIYYWTVNMI